MTVYELIRKLSKYAPDIEVFIVPQKRQKWNMKDRQRAEYVFDRGIKVMSGDEPAIEISGIPEGETS